MNTLTGAARYSPPSINPGMHTGSLPLMASPHMGLTPAQRALMAITEAKNPELTRQIDQVATRDEARHGFGGGDQEVRASMAPGLLNRSFKMGGTDPAVNPAIAMSSKPLESVIPNNWNGSATPPGGAAIAQAPAAPLTRGIMPAPAPAVRNVMPGPPPVPADAPKLAGFGQLPPQRPDTGPALSPVPAPAPVRPSPPTVAAAPLRQAELASPSPAPAPSRPVGLGAPAPARPAMDIPEAPPAPPPRPDFPDASELAAANPPPLPAPVDVPSAPIADVFGGEPGMGGGDIGGGFITGDAGPDLGGMDFTGGAGAGLDQGAPSEPGALDSLWARMKSRDGSAAIASFGQGLMNAKGRDAPKVASAISGAGRPRPVPFDAQTFFGLLNSRSA